MVYVTHDQAEAMSMADQVVLLRKGRIEQDAPPRELYESPATDLRGALHRHAADEPAALQRRPHRRQRRRRRAVGERWLGVRPEAVALRRAGVPATVRGVEYLGADTAAATARVGTRDLHACAPPGAPTPAPATRCGSHWHARRRALVSMPHGQRRFD